MEAESIHIHRAAGIEIVIAIDSTVLGPALGGCRWRLYPDSQAARRDALDLARAMTRKAALARLKLGGGKAVVVGDPEQRTREQLLAVGEFIDSLGGRYITAADMGTGEDQMAVIRERTPYVSGLPKQLGGCGDPGPFTAEGLEMAMQVALEHLGDSLCGAKVAIQGVGSVGAELARRLLAAGASVTVADTNPVALESLSDRVEIVDPEAISSVDCDIFAPCGPPAVIDAANVTRLSCRVICGGANNPLAAPELTERLEDLGVLYVPDFLANAGGLIHLAVALEGGCETASREHLRVIPENLHEVLAKAKTESIDTARAAEELALAAVARGKQFPDLR